MIWGGGPGSYGKKWNPEATKEGYGQLGSNICSPDTVEGICELYPSAKKNEMERQLIQRQRGIFLFTHPLLLSQKAGSVWRLRKVHRLKEKQFEAKDQHKYFSPILIRGCDHVQCFCPTSSRPPFHFLTFPPEELGWTRGCTSQPRIPQPPAHLSHMSNMKRQKEPTAIGPTCFQYPAMWFRSCWSCRKPKWRMKLGRPKQFWR